MDKSLCSVLNVTWQRGNVVLVSHLLLLLLPLLPPNAPAAT
jgi:hypothetical protein